METAFEKFIKRQKLAIKICEEILEEQRKFSALVRKNIKIDKIK